MSIGSGIVRKSRSRRIDIYRVSRRIRSAIRLGTVTAVEEEHDAEPLPPEMWRQNEDYLYGVDLYNFAYWWEAHEAWEGLWHQAEDTYRLFLQGLIQVSAAFIKYHTRMLRPLRTLSTAGRDKLRQVVVECDDASGNYMGLNLPAFLDTADTRFLIRSLRIPLQKRPFVSTR